MPVKIDHEYCRERKSFRSNRNRPPPIRLYAVRFKANNHSSKSAFVSTCNE